MFIILYKYRLVYPIERRIIISKITRIYGAAERATLDRYFVNRYAHGHVSKDKAMCQIDEHVYNKLVEETGSSTNNPIKMLRNWKAAFDRSMVDIKKEDAINALFEEPSWLSKAVRSIFRR